MRKQFEKTSLRLFQFSSSDKAKAADDDMLQSRFVVNQTNLQHNQNPTQTRRWRFMDEREKDDASVLRRFVKEVYITGADRLIFEHSGTCRKTVWSLLIVLSAVFLVYHMYDRYTYYARHPVNVNIYREYAHDLQFPTVTLCNLNEELMQQHRRDDTNIPGYSTHQVDSLSSHVFSRPLDAATGHTLPPTLTTSDPTYGYNWTRHYQLYSEGLDQILLHCSLARQSCKPSDFVAITTVHGLCFQLNQFQTVHSAVVGPKNGLTLILDAQYDSYDLNRTSEIGFRLAIHDKNQKNFLLNFDSISVSAGWKTSISLQKVRYVNLPEPLGDCGARPLAYFKEYSRWACLLECISNHTAEECQCRLPGMVGRGTPYCDPHDKAICHVNHTWHHYKAISVCDCPVTCVEDQYEKTATYNEYTRTHTRRKLLRPVNNSLEYWKQSIAYVQIFYERRQKVTIRQQVVFSWYAFVSHLGGAFGLSLGCSILTVAQFMDFAFMEFLFSVGLIRDRKPLSTLSGAAEIRLELEESLTEEEGENKDDVFDRNDSLWIQRGGLFARRNALSAGSPESEGRHTHSRRRAHSIDFETAVQPTPTPDTHEGSVRRFTYGEQRLIAMGKDPQPSENNCLDGACAKDTVRLARTVSVNRVQQGYENALRADNQATDIRRTMRNTTDCIHKGGNRDHGKKIRHFSASEAQGLRPVRGAVSNMNLWLKNFKLNSNQAGNHIDTSRRVQSQVVCQSVEGEWHGREVKHAAQQNLLGNQNTGLQPVKQPRSSGHNNPQSSRRSYGTGVSTQGCSASKGNSAGGENVASQREGLKTDSPVGQGLTTKPKIFHGASHSARSEPAEGSFNQITVLPTQTPIGNFPDTRGSKFSSETESHFGEHNDVHTFNVHNEPCSFV